MEHCFNACLAAYTFSYEKAQAQTSNTFLSSLTLTSLISKWKRKSPAKNTALLIKMMEKNQMPVEGDARAIFYAINSSFNANAMSLEEHTAFLLLVNELSNEEPRWVLHSPPIADSPTPLQLYLSGMIDQVPKLSEICPAVSQELLSIQAMSRELGF